MNTDQLIRTLVSDVGRRERSVGGKLAVALAVGGAVSVAIFFASLGFREDINTAIYSFFFDLKFLVTISISASAVVISLHLSRPESSFRTYGGLLLIPVGALAFGIINEMLLPQQLPWTMRWIGSNSMICVTAIPLLSLPVLIAALIALRHGAPTQPALAGALAGLLSAGFAATLYASKCTDDSPLFVATWYLIAVATMMGIGALTGNKMLRF